MPNKELLTQEDACRLLRTYPRKFAKAVKDHGIPFQVVGSHKLFTPEAVEAVRPHVVSKQYRTAAAS